MINEIVEYLNSPVSELFLSIFVFAFGFTLSFAGGYFYQTLKRLHHIINAHEAMIGSLTVRIISLEMESENIFEKALKRFRRNLDIYAHGHSKTGENPNE